MLPEYADASVTRTRDYAVLEAMDVVVDVGGTYDAATHRYDHHQPTFKDSFSPEYKTLLSSAGLVYKHFGRRIIASAVAAELHAETTGRLEKAVAAELQAPTTGQPEEALVAEIHERLYRKFVEPFDAVDNGVNQYPSELTPAYARPYDIFAQIDDLNPSWNETIDPDARFQEAVRVAGSAFSTVLRRTLQSWLPARTIVQSSLTVSCQVEDVDDARVLVLGSNCPWKDHLFELEAKLDITGRILYVIYEDRNEGTWRIQSVPARLDSFESRKMLPEAWRGLRDAELDAAVGTAGCTFVHRSGFIGGNRTLAGVKEMARKAVQAS